MKKTSVMVAKRLVSRTQPVAALSAPTIDEAFALFDASYEGAERARFERDLREKQLIILLRDRDDGRLRGFSTVLIQHRRKPHRCTVIFSGDTVIHREYWGQKQLQAAFARILVRERLRALHRPLYWFLLSKGYRTYMLLANAFPRAVPRHDGTHAGLQAMLDALATERYGDEYHSSTGIVRFTRGEHVRAGLAPITPRHLANPHVAFFVARNPRHADGDELACLAQVRLSDLVRIALRIVLAMTRRRSRPSTSERAPVSLPQGEGA